MKKPMKETMKILFIMYIIIFFCGIRNQYAINIDLNNEFEYKIKFKEKLTTMDFELIYDENNLEFVKIENDKLEYNQIEKGRLIGIYIDENGNGIDEISIIFKTKNETEENDFAKIKITEINGYSIESQKEYNNNNITLDNLESSYIIRKGNVNSTTNDKEEKQIDENIEDSPKELPKTGLRSLIFIILIVAICISFIYIFKYKNIKNILPLLLICIFLAKPTNVKAMDGIFIKEYSTFKGLDNIIIIIPDKNNRNIVKHKFKELITTETKEIVDSKGNKIEENALIGTGSIILSKDQKKHHIIMYGDINGDGKINSNDIGLILNEKIKNKRIEGIYRVAANVVNEGDSEDKKIDIYDAFRIKDYILQKLEKNLIDELPEEKITENNPINQEENKKEESQKTDEYNTENVDKEDKENKEDNNKQEDVKTDNDDNGSDNTNNLNKEEEQKDEENTNPEIPQDIKVEDIIIKTTKTTIQKGEQIQIETEVIPKEANNKVLNWTSSDNRIVMVNQNGVITGIGGGKINIYIKTTDGSNITKKIEITVNVNVQEIRLSTEEINIVKGQQTEITAQVIPNDATNKEIIWSSSNNEIATVNNGIIKAINSGECKVYARSNNGVSAQCKIKVTNPEIEEIEVSNIILGCDNLELEVDEKKTIPITIMPDNATNKDITWTSSDTTIAIVKAGEVTAISPGNCIIYATSNNGIKKQCNITVKAPTPEDIEVTSIKLNKTSETIDLSVNNTITLIATITPTNATRKNIIWTTNNPSIATVNENGIVTAKSNGTAIITATSSNGKKATCNLTVQTSPKGIYFEENLNDTNKYLEVKKGESLIPSPVLIPSTTNVNNNITYTIEEGNTNVVQIDNQNGRIIGKQAGVVKLKAKTQNNKIATIYLNVKIGNNAYDFGKTTKDNKELYCQNIKAVPNCDNAYMQSFKVDKSNNYVYYATIDTTTKEGQRTNPEISYISGAEPNQIPEQSKIMTFKYFGHQSSIDIEKGEKTYIWMDSVATHNGTYGYGSNVAISRVLYQEGASKKYTVGPYTTSYTGEPNDPTKTNNNPGECNFVWINKEGKLSTDISVSVDEKNNLLAVYRDHFIFIFDLIEALNLQDRIIYTQIPDKDGNIINIKFRAKVLVNSCTDMEKLDKTIKDITEEERQMGKISTIKAVSEIREIYRNYVAKKEKENYTARDILRYDFQGFDLDGDYIYIAESESNSNTYISKLMHTFDLDHPNYHNNIHTDDYGLVLRKAARMPITISQDMIQDMGTDTSVAPEIEGIKVDSSGNTPIMYLGFVQRSARSNIIKFSY